MNYEDLIKQAEKHLKACEYPQAIDNATQAIESDPTRVDGYYWRGVAYSRIDAYEYMLGDADTLLARSSSTARHFAYRGWAYNVKQSHVQKAINECSKAINIDPSTKEAYLYRAWARQDEKNYEAAINDCNEAIKLDSKYADVYNLRGFVYADKDNLDQAIEDYNKAIELSPNSALYRNNRLNAYHAKDKKLAMPLLDIRSNKKYMEELRNNIDNVLPFLGAGASIPYGYCSWKELLQELLVIIHNSREDVDTANIQKLINTGSYVDAATEMDEILANICSSVSTVIRRIAEANPFNELHMCSILDEYLHLFPRKTYLTTNYDKVIEDILQTLHRESVAPLYPTSGLQSSYTGSSYIGLKQPKPESVSSYEDETGNVAKVYHLHGVYDAPESIILSKFHYDEFYGIDNLKSNLRKFLPKELNNIYHNSMFLYIGCSMTMKQDRILNVLRSFHKSIQNNYFSYALLNVNEVIKEAVKTNNWKARSEKIKEAISKKAKTQDFFENWEVQSEKTKEAISKIAETQDFFENSEAQDDKLKIAIDVVIKGKEDELGEMNVRIIWFSAPDNSPDKHESAKRQLFKYILNSTRSKVRKVEMEKKITKALTMKQERERVQNAFNHISETVTPTENTNEIIFSVGQLKEFFQNKILINEDSSTECSIKFPMYKIEGGMYQINLISDNGVLYLSDDGTTYAELDKIFELKEPDVIKNLVAVLKQYGCRKHRQTNAFIINCTLEDIHVKMSYLIQAISFMLNMRIFYV